MKGITEERLRDILNKDRLLTSHEKSIVEFIIRECTELTHWQPIDENTPKNKWLLLYCPGNLIRTGAWNLIEEKWQVSGSNFKPTHWCELQEDPL